MAVMAREPRANAAFLRLPRSGNPHDLTELVLDARDPELLARFWCEVLGYVELERDEASMEIGPAGAGFGNPLLNRLRIPHPDRNAHPTQADPVNASR